MPKIVNVEQKRQDIAIASIELFLEKGYDNLTVSEVAKNAKVAKGSIYKYFESKEDIIFAIIEYAQETYDKDILLRIKQAPNIEDKILSLFDLCISTDEEMLQRRKIYKEFITLALHQGCCEKMVGLLKEIQLKYTTWLKNIFQEGIDNGILIKDAMKFADGLFVMGEGVLLYSHLENYNNKQLLQNHIQGLLELIKKDS